MTDTLFIAPDIFGHTPALDRLAEKIAGRTRPGKIKIIDPYDMDSYGNRRFFRREEAAYDYFKAWSGIPEYSRRISDKVNRETNPVALVGFSAGASAIWHLSGEDNTPPVSCALGFYGSQIRHYPDIVPGFPVHLIFPDYEPHFDVDVLARAISSTPKVSCEKAPGRHGFMNEYSRNFDPELYQSYVLLPSFSTGWESLQNNLI